MKLHYNIIVRGRVQGVGFRFEAKKMAKMIGITGFVKNQYNGDVYIEAEGTEEQLRQFIIWCKKGPLNARVDEITTEKVDFKGFEFFDIR